MMPSERDPVEDQKPLYSDCFHESMLALVRGRLHFFDVLVSMLLGRVPAPRHPKFGNDETQIASMKRQNVFVAVGRALIDKYAPGYILPEDDQDNNNNQIPARRGRNEGEESSGDSSSSSSEPIMTAEPSPTRVQCALAFSVVLVYQVFTPIELGDFGKKAMLAINALVTLDDAIDRGLWSSTRFLDRLRSVIEENHNLTHPPRSGNSVNATFVAQLLRNFPPPALRNDINIDAQPRTPRGSGISSSPTGLSGQKFVVSQAQMSVTLGFVDYPTVSIHNNNASTSYTLGCMLGKGESCRTYGLVLPELFNDTTKIVAGDCEKAFVVKMFPMSDGAERESKVYDLVEKHNVRGTTKIFRGANVNGTLPQTDGKMLVVSPRGEKFRVVYAGRASIDSREPAPQEITDDHVAQLVEALWSLHLIGVVHADIQHQNLFYDSGDKSKAMLNDFGRSRMITSMSFCEFRARMLRDWKMLEAAFCDPIAGSRSLYMANGANAWKKFWESSQRRTEERMTEFINNNFSSKEHFAKNSLLDE